MLHSVDNGKFHHINSWVSLYLCIESSICIFQFKVNGLILRKGKNISIRKIFNSVHHVTCCSFVFMTCQNIVYRATVCVSRQRIYITIFSRTFLANAEFKSDRNSRVFFRLDLRHFWLKIYRYTSCRNSLSASTAPRSGLTAIFGCSVDFPVLISPFSFFYPHHISNRQQHQLMSPALTQCTHTHVHAL